MARIIATAILHRVTTNGTLRRKASSGIASRPGKDRYWLAVDQLGRKRSVMVAENRGSGWARVSTSPDPLRPSRRKMPRKPPMVSRPPPSQVVAERESLNCNSLGISAVGDPKREICQPTAGLVVTTPKDRPTKVTLPDRSTVELNDHADLRIDCTFVPILRPDTTTERNQR